MNENGCGLTVLGSLLVLGGLVGIIAANNMDTTVSTGGGYVGYGEFRTYVPSTTVNNLGKMDERRNYIIISSVVLVVGVILLGFGLSSQAPQPKPTQNVPRCPRCNGPLEGTPEVCMHCRTELRWVDGRAMIPEEAMSLLKKQREEKRLQEEAAERRFKQQQQDYAKQQDEFVQSCKDAWKNIKAFSGWLASIVVWACGRLISLLCWLGVGVAVLLTMFDTGLKKVVGEENTIVYHFFQVLIYVGFPIFVSIVLILRQY